MVVTLSGARLTAPCPFHQDSNPSFSVYRGQDGKERWGCFACSIGGDVLDLIRQFDSSESLLRSHIEEASDLLEELDESDWQAPEIKERESISPEDIEQTVTDSQLSPDLDMLGEFIEHKRYPFSPEWWTEEFGVGTEHSPQRRLVVPVYNRGSLFTYKSWYKPEGRRITAGGTVFGSDILYAPREEDDISLPAWICEGESDVWSTWFRLKGRVYPYGVLAGAGTKPALLERFKRRTVYLAFDGDPAGIKGSRVWAEALAGVADRVLIVPIAPGKDVASTLDIQHAMDRARPPVSRPTGIMEGPTGYFRPGESASPISNWTFEAHRELKSEAGSFYEGQINPGGQTAVLSSADLSNRRKLIQWAQKQGRAWYGSDRDAQLLSGIIQSDASYIPSGEIVETAGLYRRQYVWPGGMIGADYLRYSPPVIDAHIGGLLHLSEKDYDKTEISLLRDTQRGSTADPILAWLVASLYRPCFGAFPILVLTGTYGSGKTTTTELLVRRITGSHIQATMTVTSPHALSALIASTNAFPVHLDEYRRGARQDTMETARQLFRDAYTMQKSHKGGMSENVSELGTITPSAPIIVSGEDTFNEGSLSDRMVFVRMNKRKHNYQVFNELQRREESGLPRALLEYAYDRMKDPEFITWLNVPEHAPAELSSRQKANFSVLQKGWRIVDDFCGGELGDPNLTEVLEEWHRSNNKNPLDRSLADALSASGGEPTGVTKQGDDVLVNLSVFMNYLRRNHVSLPGGRDAIERDIIDRFNAKEERIEIRGLPHFVLVLKYADLIVETR